MGDAKEGFKKAGASFTTIETDVLEIQTDKDGPFYDERLSAFKSRSLQQTLKAKTTSLKAGNVSNAGLKLFTLGNSKASRLSHSRSSSGRSNRRTAS